jgi:hypothetical protein
VGRARRRHGGLGADRPAPSRVGGVAWRARRSTCAGPTPRSSRPGSATRWRSRSRSRSASTGARSRSRCARRATTRSSRSASCTARG